jgi:hypothetical protein
VFLPESDRQNLGDVVAASLLPRWPLLRAMQDTQYSHFILRLKDFVNPDIRGRGKCNLPCACDAPRASDTRKYLQLLDPLHH